MGYPYSKIIAIEIGHLSPTTLSGGDKLLLDLMPYLKQVPIKVVIPEIATGHWKKYKSRTVVVHHDNYLLRILATIKLLNRHSPDIVVSNTNYFPDILPTWYYKITHPRAVWLARVLHLSNPPWRRPGNLVVNIYAYAMQSLCLFLANRWADLSLALNPDIFSKLKTIHKDILPVGIEIPKIAAVRPTKNTPAFDVVFVGRFHPAKGINDLPIIMDLLPQYNLGVIGEGAVDWHRDNITILGRVNDRRKIQILKLAKVFICTDYEAGWGLAIAEAMACGLPVVGYDLPIWNSVFKQGFALAPLGNVDKFAALIASILQNKRLRTDLSKLAKARARRLSLVGPAKKYIAILNRYS